MPENYKLAIVFIKFRDQETSPVNLAHESCSPFLGKSKSGAPILWTYSFTALLNTRYREPTEANMHLQLIRRFSIRIRVWFITTNMRVP
jgi:hypothetical protein